jgi:hypothetical protein
MKRPAVAVLILVLLALVLALLLGPCALTSNPTSPEPGAADGSTGPADPDGGSSG